MQKRLVAIFIPASTEANPRPSAVQVYRGSDKSFLSMWQKCQMALPAEFGQENGTGFLLVGREDNVHIKNPSQFAPAAQKWQGTNDSGSAMEFFRQHTKMYLSAAVTTPPTTADAVAA